MAPKTAIGSKRRPDKNGFLISEIPSEERNLRMSGQFGFHRLFGLFWAFSLTNSIGPLNRQDEKKSLTPGGEGLKVRRACRSGTSLSARFVRPFRPERLFPRIRSGVRRGRWKYARGRGHSRQCRGFLDLALAPLALLLILSIE